MPTTLTTKAVRGSSYAINSVCKDEDGTVVTPDSAEYTLTDANGTVINSLSGVSMTPSESMDVMLSGDDLEFETAEKGTYQVTRIFTVTAQYDSDIENDLPLIDSCTFYIIDPNALG